MVEVMEEKSLPVMPKIEDYPNFIKLRQLRKIPLKNVTLSLDEGTEFEALAAAAHNAIAEFVNEFMSLEKAFQRLPEGLRLREEMVHLKKAISEYSTKLRKKGETELAKRLQTDIGLVEDHLLTVLYQEYVVIQTIENTLERLRELEEEEILTIISDIEEFTSQLKTRKSGKK